MTFDFDPALSATQNIDKFHKYLESVDSEFAAVLRTQLTTMLPLSEVTSQRTASRQKFNEAVLKHLDQPKAGAIK
jgi:hypothetical protein